jgi:hypothetical protein
MRVPVAYENPQVAKRRDAYRLDVGEALLRMGAPVPRTVLDLDAAYIKAAYDAGLDAKTTAAIIYHKHAGGAVIAGDLKAACPPPEVVAPGACSPFKEGPPDEACRKRALALGSLTNPRSVYALLRPDLEQQLQEIFVVVGLDVNGVLVCYREVARGQVDHVAVAPADVLRPVLIAGCKAFLVAHNHPSGNAKPSREDGALTERMKEASKPFAGLVFLDHLVIGKGEVYSFTEKKLTRVSKR